MCCLHTTLPGSGLFHSVSERELTQLPPETVLPTFSCSKPIIMKLISNVYVNKILSSDRQFTLFQPAQFRTVF